MMRARLKSLTVQVALIIAAVLLLGGATWLWLWNAEGLLVETIKPGLTWMQAVYFWGLMGTSLFFLGLDRKTKRD